MQGVLAFAVVPAFFGFLRLLKSTIMESHYEEVYDKIRKSFKKKDQDFLNRLGNKFYFFGKGVKKFNAAKADIFEEVYDALLMERLLEIKTEADGGNNSRIIKPLTLLMFNNGLYLVALRHDQEPATRKPYHIRLEAIVSAKKVKNGKFLYPADYDPAELYDGEFGLFRGSHGELVDIELHFADDDGMKRYIRERTWTKWDDIKEKKDGTLVLKMKASDFKEIKAFVLSCGDKVEVVKPLALRNEVKETVASLMKVYKRTS
jgi:predicted DNA-binding transcriptional regulator YafY